MLHYWASSTCMTHYWFESPHSPTVLSIFIFIFGGLLHLYLNRDLNEEELYIQAYPGRDAHEWETLQFIQLKVEVWQSEWKERTDKLVI